MEGRKLTRNRYGRKKRKVGIRNVVENTYYIFCEGEKTEPLYFREMANVIAHNAIYKNVVQVFVKGTGLNTTGIVEYAARFINENGITKGSVWCVFDKDDFPAKKFDSSSKLANEYTKKTNKLVQYQIAWSNECIEYWFLLHFGYLDANISRTDYQERLTKYFHSNGHGAYAKNSDELFDILTNDGNPKKAIRWAEKRLDSYDTDTILNHPSKIAPGTTVYKLVKVLAKYFPDEIRGKYL